MLQTRVELYEQAAKQSYYRLQCTKLRNNTKKLSQLINDMINKTPNKLHVIDCLTVNGMKLTDPKGIANEFGSYFANVGKNFAEKIKKCKTAVNKYICHSSRPFCTRHVPGFGLVGRTPGPSKMLSRRDGLLGHQARVRRAPLYACGWIRLRMQAHA